MYWRRFAISSIPLDDAKAFENWIMTRWREKDHLLEHFYSTGKFPPTQDDTLGKGQLNNGYIETEVKLKSTAEIAQIFMVFLTLALIANVFTKLYEMVFKVG